MSIHWFKCKGCGKAIGLFPDGIPGDSQAHQSAVMHEKPKSVVGIRGSVQCSLFNRSSGEELMVLHKDAEPIDSTDYSANELAGMEQPISLDKILE